MVGIVSLRALAPSLTRITIAAAIGAALHMGQGNKTVVDQKAVEFSRNMLNQTEIDGEVIVCEGRKTMLPPSAEGRGLERAWDPRSSSS